MGPFVAAWAAGHAAARDSGREAEFAAAFGAERQAQSEWIADPSAPRLTPPAQR